MESQLYINNISGCIGTVNILPAKRQDHQCYTLNKFATIFTSLLYPNHNNIQQSYYILTEQFTIPNLLFLIMSTSNNTGSGYTENITISNECTTIHNSHLPYLNQSDIGSTIQVSLGRSKE